MENTETEKKVVQIVLKTLDQLKFKYNNTKEHLAFMFAKYYENQEMYDNVPRSFYSVPFLMEYNPDFGETQSFSAYVDASTMKVISIGIAHGNLEIIYDDNGKAIDTKFISPSFPYENQ